MNSLDIPGTAADGRRSYISRETELELIRRAKEGDNRSFERLLASGESLIKRWSFSMKNSQEQNVPIDELKEAAREGAWKALKRFDESRGYRFMTYAQYWIKIEMSRYMRGKLIQKKSTAGQVLSEFLRIRFEFYLLRGRNPSYREIAEIWNRDSGKKLTPQDVESALCHAVMTTYPVSLSHPLYDEDGAATVEDRLGDADAEMPDEIVIRAVTREIAEKALARIGQKDPRYETILRRRFGFEGKEETLNEIGRDMRLTRERIRQLESKALRSLKGVLVSAYQAEDFSL